MNKKSPVILLYNRLLVEERVRSCRRKRIVRKEKVGIQVVSYLPILCHTCYILYNKYLILIIKRERNKKEIEKENINYRDNS